MIDTESGRYRTRLSLQPIPRAYLYRYPIFYVPRVKLWTFHRVGLRAPRSLIKCCRKYCTRQAPPTTRWFDSPTNFNSDIILTRNRDSYNASRSERTSRYTNIILRLRKLHGEWSLNKSSDSSDVGCHCKQEWLNKSSDWTRRDRNLFESVIRALRVGFSLRVTYSLR